MANKTIVPVEIISMDPYQQIGAQFRAFLLGLSGTDRSRPLAEASIEAEVEARARRRNTSLIPNSRHYATMLAYGDFILADGMNIRCEAIQGISGVITLPTVKTVAAGRPEVQLRRFLTHFFFENPPVVIEQNPKKDSTGFLQGAASGDVSALLPGRASFSQFLILSLAGKPLANRDPLTMTAERVDEWPPIGSTFVSEKPTDFYELEKLDDPAARPFASLAACKSGLISELTIPDR
jgi:hypothetical protein